MTTFERIINVFNDVFENKVTYDDVNENSSLAEDIGVDSIGMLYVAMALEEEFGIKFKNEDLQSLHTVGDVISCVDSRLNQL